MKPHPPEHPKVIYLLTDPHAGETSWCSDPDPSGDDDDYEFVTRYVRDDTWERKKTDDAAPE